MNRIVFAIQQKQMTSLIYYICEVILYIRNSKFIVLQQYVYNLMYNKIIVYDVLKSKTMTVMKDKWTYSVTFSIYPKSNLTQCNYLLKVYSTHQEYDSIFAILKGNFIVRANLPTRRRRGLFLDASFRRHLFIIFILFCYGTNELFLI